MAHDLHLSEGSYDLKQVGRTEKEVTERAPLTGNRFVTKSGECGTNATLILGVVPNENLRNFR